MAETLPVGYQFCPSDEQLFSQYLARQVEWDLAFSEFREFNVYEKEPWKFFDKNVENSLYVFTKLKMKKSRVDRTAGLGYWKGVKTTDIKDGYGNVVGHKKHFNFKAKDGSCSDGRNAEKGSWIMHEYSILNQEIVLCKIRFKKEESNGKQGAALVLRMPIRTAENHRQKDSSDFNNEVGVPPQDINMKPSKTTSLFSSPHVEWQPLCCAGSEGDMSSLASHPCSAISARPALEMRDCVGVRRRTEQSLMEDNAASNEMANSPASGIVEEITDGDDFQWILDNISFDHPNVYENPKDDVVLGGSPPASDATT